LFLIPQDLERLSVNNFISLVANTRLGNEEPYRNHYDLHIHRVYSGTT